MSINRDQSPLSPTLIHYRQKYQISNSSANDHYNKSKRNPSSSSSEQSSNIWQRHKSSSGLYYYYNIITDQSQWEKPSEKQLSRSINNKCSYSNKNVKKSKRFIWNYRSNKRDSQRTSSSFRKSQNDKIKTCEIHNSSPISPPENEKIQLHLVDPVLTPSKLSISSNHQQKHSIKTQINENISSIMNNSSIQPTPSTINAILELQHSSFINYSNSDIIRECHSGESIQSKTTRLLNQQDPYITSELVSLRTDVYLIRIRNEQNRFKLLKYHSKLSS